MPDQEDGQCREKRAEQNDDEPHAWKTGKPTGYITLAQMYRHRPTHPAHKQTHPHARLRTQTTRNHMCADTDTYAETSRNAHTDTQNQEYAHSLLQLHSLAKAASKCGCGRLPLMFRREWRSIPYMAKRLPPPPPLGGHERTRRFLINELWERGQPDPRKGGGSNN